VRTSKEQRRQFLDEFGRSGVSAVAFARRSGVKYSTLAGWRQRTAVPNDRGWCGPSCGVAAGRCSARDYLCCTTSAGGRAAPGTGQARRRTFSFCGSLKVFFGLETCDIPTQLSLTDK